MFVYHIPFSIPCGGARYRTEVHHVFLKELTMISWFFLYGENQHRYDKQSSLLYPRILLLSPWEAPLGSYYCSKSLRFANGYTLEHIFRVIFHIANCSSFHVFTRSGPCIESLSPSAMSKPIRPLFNSMLYKHLLHV